MLVCIDPGHGGNDPGALGPGGRREKDDNLRYALGLRGQLEAQGVKTLLTRESDVAVDLNARPAAANKARADLFISCHRNSAGDGGPNGVEIWLHTDATANMVQWAARMIGGFTALGFVARATNNPGWPPGVKRGYTTGVDDNFAVNRLSTMPSMLIELGFVPNPGDNALFDAHVRGCCEVIARSTCEYLGVGYKAQADTVSRADYKALEARCDALEARYEELWERYDSLVDSVKALAKGL